MENITLFIPLRKVPLTILDKSFLQSLKMDTVFSRRMVACVVDESHTIETWTGLRRAIFMLWIFRKDLK